MPSRCLLSAVFVQLSSACCEHSAFVDYDKKTGNLLFRTGDPLESKDHKEIDFKPLMKQFKHAAEEAGAAWPEDYFVQDFSLWTDESDYIEAEKKYWESNPALGNVTHWPIYGLKHSTLKSACKQYKTSTCADSSDQPKSMSSADVRTLGEHYLTWASVDNLSDRLATINNALHTKFDKPQVLFFHCTCGCDRTGEFYAAYAIRYLNQKWTDAMNFDVKLIGRNPTYNNMVMSQWYCEYLSASGQYQHDDCGNCKPFRCNDDDDDALLNVTEIVR